MFKKAAEAKSQQRLSGADRKKLKRAVKERFPNADDSHIDLLLPPKVEIVVTKYPNRVLVYGLEGWEIYALWKVPDLLPSFMLKGGEVSRYVLGGADLMFPGIHFPAEGFPSFLAGELWAVKVPGNSAPIAVGTTTMSSTAALNAGLRGKALKISHYYRDTLCLVVPFLRFGEFITVAGMDCCWLAAPFILGTFYVLSVPWFKILVRRFSSLSSIPKKSASSLPSPRTTSSIASPKK